MRAATPFCLAIRDPESHKTEMCAHNEYVIIKHHALLASIFADDRQLRHLPHRGEKGSIHLRSYQRTLKHTNLKKKKKKVREKKKKRKEARLTHPGVTSAPQSPQQAASSEQKHQMKRIFFWWGSPPKIELSASHERRPDLYRCPRTMPTSGAPLYAPAFLFCPFCFLIASFSYPFFLLCRSRLQAREIISRCAHHKSWPPFVVLLGLLSLFLLCNYIFALWVRCIFFFFPFFSSFRPLIHFYFTSLLFVRFMSRFF